MIGALIARRAIAGSFEALNRHDLARFMSAWREDGTFVYPGEIPASGTFKGISAVEGWFRNFFDQFPGTNVVAVHWNLQLRNRSGRAGQNSGVTVISINGGKVVMVRDFIFDLGENFKLNWGAA
jgi:ketosteroid isomerase-like protein